MSNLIMNLCWPLQMPPSVKAVLMAIAWHANDAGEGFPSLGTLGVKTSLGKTAVISAIAWLEDNRVLTIKRGGSTRGGTKFSNRYTILTARLDPELFAEKPRRGTKPVRATDQSGDDEDADLFVRRTGTDACGSRDQAAGATGPVGEPVCEANRYDASTNPDQSAGQTGPQERPVRLAVSTGPSGEPDRSVWRSKPVRQTDPNRQEPSITVIEPSSAQARDGDDDDAPRLTASEVERELTGIPSVPAGLAREVLARFVRHRRAQGRALTISGWLSLLPRFRELAGGGHDLNESLRQTMAAGLSLPVTPTKKGTNHATHRESAADRVRRFAEDGERRDAAEAARAFGQDGYPDAVGADG